MLILEKIRNKYHQIWITVDIEKRDSKFDCRLKGENQTVLHSNRPGTTPSLAMGVCQSSYHLCIWTFLINSLPCLPPSIPFSSFRLPCSVAASSPARDSRGRFCKEDAPRPRPHPSSSVLSATPAKRVRFRGNEEEPSQCAAPMHLPWCSMEGAGSSSAQGRKSYTRARAKLADSSDARHGEVGCFPQREGRSGPHTLRWARTPPATTRVEEWCW
jgi:hypothetical protein